MANKEVESRLGTCRYLPELHRQYEHLHNATLMNCLEWRPESGAAAAPPPPNCPHCKKPIAQSSADEADPSKCSFSHDAQAAAEAAPTLIEIRRGFGEFDMSTLQEGETVAASGLHDGGWVVERPPLKTSVCKLHGLAVCAPCLAGGSWTFDPRALTAPPAPQAAAPKGFDCGWHVDHATHEDALACAERGGQAAAPLCPKCGHAANNTDGDGRCGEPGCECDYSRNISAKCDDAIGDDGSVDCQKPKGHDGPHRNGDYYWIVAGWMEESEKGEEPIALAHSAFLNTPIFTKAAAHPAEAEPPSADDSPYSDENLKQEADYYRREYPKTDLVATLNRGELRSELKLAIPKLSSVDIEWILGLMQTQADEFASSLRDTNEFLERELANFRRNSEAQAKEFESLRDTNTALREKLEAAERILPESFFADRELAFRFERIVDVWQRSVKSNQSLESELETLRAERDALKQQIAEDETEWWTFALAAEGIKVLPSRDEKGTIIYVIKNERAEESEAELEQTRSALRDADDQVDYKNIEIKALQDKLRQATANLHDFHHEESD